MDKASKVLKSLERECVSSLRERSVFIPSIGPLKGAVVSKVVKKYKPKNILEIGTLYGYSAILMARLLPRKGRVVTIEKDKGTARIAKNHIEDAGLSDKVEVIVGDALEIVPTLKRTFDFLFLDGVKEEYFGYLKLAEKNLNRGSVVVADNVGIFAKSMSNFLDYVRNSGKYKSETVMVPLEFHDDIEDAMEISIKL